MKRKGFLAALAMSALLTAATVAPAQRVGIGRRGGYRPFYRPGFGYRPFYRPGIAFGLGFGGYGGYAAPRATYQNAFTSDVAYAERAVNDFRAEYERRKGDPLGVKRDVQRLDETMERLRREAERSGAATDRGSDLMRNAIDAEVRIDRRFRDANDSMDRRWNEVRRMIDRLSRDYRAS